MGCYVKVIFLTGRGDTWCVYSFYLCLTYVLFTVLESGVFPRY